MEDMWDKKLEEKLLHIAISIRAGFTQNAIGYAVADIKWLIAEDRRYQRKEKQKGDTQAIAQCKKIDEYYFSHKIL